MPDVLDRLDQLVPDPHEVRVDPAWTKVHRRTTRARRVRRLGTGLVGVVVLVAALALVDSIDGANDETRVATEPEQPAPVDLPEGSSQLPPLPSPLEPRYDPAFAAQGGDLFLWGGANMPSSLAERHQDGAIYDSATRSWTVLPPAPPNDLERPIATWAGSHIILVDGVGNTSMEHLIGWDTADERWFETAPAPEGCAGRPPVWTGDELVVTCWRDVGERSFAAYDPTTDVWRTHPDTPIPLAGRSLAWTGGELLVIGWDDRWGATWLEPHAFALDPDAPSWRALPTPPIDLEVASATLTDDRLVVVNLQSEVAALELASETWEVLGSLTGDAAVIEPDATALGARALLASGGVLALLGADDTLVALTTPTTVGLSLTSADGIAYTAGPDGVAAFRPAEGP